MTPAAGHTTQSQATVLIVDDESSGRETIGTLLEPEGYRLLFAVSGPEALALAADSMPDLILLDLMMPGMDGYEVCGTIRADAKMNEVPIIMLTALDDRASRLRGIEAGADDFITKPFDHYELRLRVKTTARLNRYRKLLGERTRFERMFELSPDGIFIVDADGVVRLANPALEKMLGFDAETHVIGRSLMEFIAPEQLDHCQACFQQLMAQDGNPVRVETWLLRQSGEPLPVEVNAGRFEWLGAPAAQVFVRDITERQAFARRLVEAQETERRFIARELHDEIGQLLTGLKISTDNAARLPAEALPKQLDVARKLVDELLSKVRALSLDLRPQMLDELGLLPALELFLDRFTAQTGVQVDFKQVGLNERLAPEIETAAYRVVQEALTNVARHAQIKKTAVRLWLSHDGLGIQVTDEGIGFDPQSVGLQGRSCGLAGMRERMLLLGGSLRIDSTPGGGTNLMAHLPLRKADSLKGRS